MEVIKPDQADVAPAAAYAAPARLAGNPAIWWLEGGGGTKRQILSTLMFAGSSCRRRNSLLVLQAVQHGRLEQGRRHDHETTVDHALMRGLVTAGPVMRRGASSV